MALVLSMSTTAQTGLVFSQCLTFGGNTWTAISGDYYSPTFVVPNGKIWKIEHASCTANSSTLWNNVMQINGFSIAYFPNNYSTFPIWLKSGDIIRFRSQYSSPDYFISILEFNSN